MRLIDADALRDEVLNSNDPVLTNSENVYYILNMIDCAPTMPRWISVSENAQPNTEVVLLFSGGTAKVYRTRAEGNTNVWLSNGSSTHWMPLPEPPPSAASEENEDAAN